MKFSELQLNANVLEALDAMRFDECTPIQEQAIPIILEDKDLIAVAQTGTGKTAAFLLPVLNKLSEGNHPEDAINCIIMSPTRELAQQIDQQMEGFSYFMPVSSVAVYGGNDGILFEQQKKGLTLGADVVIATPGRLIAHLSLGYVDLSKVSYFILDEADRMLDMGFYDDIMQIVKYLPKERQTIMFSATMPAKIQQLANTILNNPSEIKLENPSTARDPCSSSILISRPSAPVHTAVVAPVVSAADTRKTIAIVKNAPRSKTGLWEVKNTSFGRLNTPTCSIVFVIPEKSTIGALPATVNIMDRRYPQTRPTSTFRFLYTPFNR